MQEHDAENEAIKSSANKETVPPVVLNSIRGFGACMMVFGTMVAFNTGGLTSMLMQPDGTFEYIMGGVFFAFGLFEFLAMPALVVKIKSLNK